MRGRGGARGEGLLVADTSRDPDDVVVHDVMLGYARIADELEQQFAQDPWPTHVFVQAGVGGLAAAIAQGLVPRMRAPARCVVVEPERAACVGLALTQGSALRLAHDPVGVASMLACGEASAPAVRILLRHAAQAVAVDDVTLREAETLMADAGIATTTSGAAGFAGLLHVARDPARREALALDAHADVVLLVTEAPLPAA